MLAGFSLWFAYIYAVTLGAFIIYCLLTDRSRFSVKFLTVGALSFCAGFSLWGFFYWKNHFQSFMVQGAPLWQSLSFHSLFAPFYSWREFFGARILFEMRHRPLAGSSYGMILAVYAFLFVVAFLSSFMKSGKTAASGTLFPDKLFLIYLMLHAVACQLYDDVGLRYLLPAYPFAAAWIASRLSCFPRGKRMPIILIVCLAFFGIVSTVWRFSSSHKGEFLKRLPYAEVPPVMENINHDA